MQGIYAIVNTVNGKRYVGSAVSIEKRWEMHRWYLTKGKHHCQHLQRAWQKHGAESFQWAVLEEVAEVTTLLAREQHWIDATPVTVRYNTSPTAGSNRGYVQPPEVRRKHAVSWLGRHLSPEHAAKLIASRKGVPMPDDAKKAISEALRQRIRKPETFRKISEAKKGKPMSEAHKHALSEAKKGKSWSEARRAAAAAITPEAAAERSHKISEAKKGNPLSDAHRQALSAAGKGKPHSEAHNRAVSEALTGRPKTEAHRRALSEALKGRPKPRKVET